MWQEVVVEYMLLNSLKNKLGIQILFKRGYKHDQPFSKKLKQKKRAGFLLAVFEPKALQKFAETKIK